MVGLFFSIMYSESGKTCFRILLDPELERVGIGFPKTEITLNTTISKGKK